MTPSTKKLLLALLALATTAISLLTGWVNEQEEHAVPLPKPPVVVPKPVPPIPAIEQFHANLQKYGLPYCTTIIKDYDGWKAEGSSSPPALDIYAEGGRGSYYYDGTQVLYAVADYLDRPAPWKEAAAKQLDVLDGAYYAPNKYQLPGYKHFVRGLWQDFQERNRPESREAIRQIRDNAAYALDSNDLSNPARSRELAYHLAAHIYAAKAGFESRTVRYKQCLDWAYSDFEHWFVKRSWQGQDQALQPFKVGLLARVLIEDFETSKDARCLPAMKAACAFLWDDAWHEASAGMRYQLNPLYTGEGSKAGEARSFEGSPDLNNLIGPMYAWVAVQTGEEAYMQKADQLFAGCVTNGWLERGKQFNQHHTWVFDYFVWRKRFYERLKAVN